MAITGIPPNGWGGGYGAPPPPDHHIDVVVGSTVNGTGPPVCAYEWVYAHICDGPCWDAGTGNSIPHGTHSQYPIGYGGNVSSIGWLNSWGQINGNMSIDYQLIDANGIPIQGGPYFGAGIPFPSCSGPPGPWGWVWCVDISPLSNPNPGQPDSYIYRTTTSSIGANLFVGSKSMTTTIWQVPFGNYTLKLWNASGDCYHANLPVQWTSGPGQNPSNHPIPIGQGNTPGNTVNLPITVTDSPGSLIQTNWNGQGWSGCGPQPSLEKWVCLKKYAMDYNCEEYGGQGQISDYDVMMQVWNMAKNFWGVGENFGWTESTSQHPPSGATHIESDQSVDLTRPGEILDGLQPYTTQTVGQNTWLIPNTNISLSQYISVFPVNIGAAIPDMPATPVSNAWTIAQNVPPGGVTTYSPLDQNHPQAGLWNPPPNATPGPNIVGGYTSYRGVVIPPIGATTTTSLDNTFHGTPTWIPFHDSLSSCIACCGDVSHQFDENLQINPYYGPYMTPPGWNDPNLPTPSQNAGFEAWLNGTNPWGIPLPREQAQVDLYKFHNGANMCGRYWISDGKVHN